MTYAIKIDEPDFEMIERGEQPFLLIKNNQIYTVKDKILLQAIDESGKYTGEEITKQIMKVNSGLPGLHAKYCLLSFGTVKGPVTAWPAINAVDKHNIHIQFPLPSDADDIKDIL